MGWWWVVVVPVLIPGPAPEDRTAYSYDYGILSPLIEL